MNWINFNTANYELTDEEVATLSKQIVAEYRKAVLDINSQIAAQYAKVLAGVSAENYYNEMIKYDRLVNLQKSIVESYRQYSKNAQRYIENAVSISASNTFYRTVYAQSWLVPEAGKAVIPYDLIELMVYGSAAEWKAIPEKRRRKYESMFGKLTDVAPQSGTLVEQILKNRTAEIEKIQSTIAIGLRQGKSYTAIAKDIKECIGAVIRNKDGTITTTGSMANALRIVSTESTRCKNAASYASTQYLQNVTGSKVEKMWLAANDSKTRQTHAHLDGKTVPANGYFYIGSDSALYPGGFSQVGNNARCRCTYVEVIDGQKPTLRSGRNPTTGEQETFDYKDFTTWAKEKGLRQNIYGEYYY